MKTKLAYDVLRTFLLLNACALLGFGTLLVLQWNRLAGYAAGAEAFMLVVALFAVAAGSRYDAHLARRREHERELVKLGKKKGIEF